MKSKDIKFNIVILMYNYLCYCDIIDKFVNIRMFLLNGV